MKATDILMNEHRVIEGVLDALDAATTRLENNEAVDPTLYLKAADFIKGFADGCHHHKEEDVLFVELEARGLPREEGPVHCMLADHEEARCFTKAMRAAAQRLQDGDADARIDIARNARGYTTLLRQHIMKEDNVLFPMAAQLIPAAEEDEVLQAYARVEHEDSGPGVHEKYLALAEEIKAMATA